MILHEDDKSNRGIQDFHDRHSGFFYALQVWTETQRKDFGPWTALKAVYDAANGDTRVMCDIIRSVIRCVNGTDIVRTNDGGVAKVVGYRTGERSERGVTAITNVAQLDEFARQYLRKRARGAGEPPRSIVVSMLGAIDEYHRRTGMGLLRIKRRLETGQLIYSIRKDMVGARGEIREAISGRVVILSEDVSKELQMTEHKFNFYVRKFLAELLDDPVNAEPSDVMSVNGLDRKALLDILKERGIVVMDAKIHDKDENGQASTAMMNIRFRIPKKGFAAKIRNLYDELFPEDDGDRLDETDCGSIGGGGENNFDNSAFVHPVGLVIRREGGNIDGDPYDRTPGEVAMGGGFGKKEKKKREKKHGNSHA